MVNDQKSPTLKLSIDVDAITRPAQAAAVRNSELVNFCFIAFSQADLSQAPLNDQSRYRFNAPNIGAEHRRDVYEHWILSKALQDLMRGIRLSLEQAYFAIQLTDGPKKAASNSTLEEFLTPFRKKASDKNFPDLLTEVNARLKNKLQFADAYLSLQKARNCLEHRDGIVGKEDINAGDCLELRFPRVKNFFVRKGEEIELLPGTVVNDGTDGKEVQIFTKLEARVLLFTQGQHLKISFSDFSEIAFACNHFGTALAHGLRDLIPVSDEAATNPSHRY